MRCAGSGRSFSETARSFRSICSATSRAARREERLRNFAKLVVACDVPDYAKQVADVGVIREGAGGPFAVEDRDALESCVSAMTGDSGGEVLVGIGETESLESLVDEQQYKGVLSSKKRLLSQLLLVMAFE
jgi:hypothetical protein